MKYSLSRTMPGEDWLFCRDVYARYCIVCGDYNKIYQASCSCEEPYDDAGWDRLERHEILTQAFKLNWPVINLFYKRDYKTIEECVDAVERYWSTRSPAMLKVLYKEYKKFIEIGGLNVCQEL